MKCQEKKKTNAEKGWILHLNMCHNRDSIRQRAFLSKRKAAQSRTYTIPQWQINKACHGRQSTPGFKLWLLNIFVAVVIVVNHGMRWQPQRPFVSFKFITSSCLVTAQPYRCDTSVQHRMLKRSTCPMTSRMLCAAKWGLPFSVTPFQSPTASGLFRSNKIYIHTVHTKMDNSTPLLQIPFFC